MGKTAKEIEKLLEPFGLRVEIDSYAIKVFKAGARNIGPVASLPNSKESLKRIQTIIGLDPEEIPRVLATEDPVEVLADLCEECLKKKTGQRYWAARFSWPAFLPLWLKRS